MKYFLTSDLHLGHDNIRRYCSRPFKDLNHMNSELVRRWNERVSLEDQVFHLGDFCFRNSSDTRGEGSRTTAQEWLQKLNGHKVMVRGNHDRNNSLRTLVQSCVIEFAGKEYFCVHKPDDANHDYMVTFCGHVHERWKYRLYGETTLINVGCDVNDFYPKTIDEILGEFKAWHKNNRLEPYTPWAGKEQ